MKHLIHFFEKVNEEEQEPHLIMKDLIKMSGQQRSVLGIIEDKKQS